ncbi:MAG: hypothetical protein AAF938_28515, partial [Myxococcota bacterium]
DTPAAAGALVGAGVGASLLLVVDHPARRPAAWLLWFVLACLFARNPLIRNPSLPFVGLLLIAEGMGGGAVYRKRVLWAVLAIGYAYSGLTKLASPSWLDGTAVTAILENPLARPTALRAWLLDLPHGFRAAASYGTLVLEIAFPLLAASKRGRAFAWTAMTGLQLSLLVLIDFADLTWGMLIMHLYVFELRWLGAPLRRWLEGFRRRRLARAQFPSDAKTKG